MSLTSAQIQQLLVRFGLSQHEAQVYRAALKLGPASVAALSDSSSVKRTTIYSVVTSLVEKGLMVIRVEKIKNLYAAEPPERLEELLRSKQEALFSILPELKRVFNVNETATALKIYTGQKAIRGVYNDLVRDAEVGKDYFVLANVEAWFQSDEQFYTKFLEKRAAKKIEVRSLFIDSDLARRLQTLSAKTRMQVRILPKHVHFLTNIVIIPNRVVVHQLEGVSQAVVFENKNLVQAMKQIFEIIWIGLEGKLTI